MKKSALTNLFYFFGLLYIIFSFSVFNACTYNSSSSEEISDTTGPGGTDFVFGYNELTDQVVARKMEDISGIHHGHRISPRDPFPNDQVTVTFTVGPAVNARDAWCYYTTDGSDPLGANGVAQVGTAVPFELSGLIWEDLVWGYVTELRAAIPGQPDDTFVKYLIECDGQYAHGGEGSDSDTKFYAYSVDRWEIPEWIHDAVMYYVMPDRFYPGDGREWIQTDDIENIMGGTLKGILDKLDYLQDLGFNCVWLMPWMEGPTYHKYGATDFYAVDDDFGTEQDLRDLIDDAHSRGMKVLVDFVGNHCSNEHPFFVEAESDPDGKYRDWFYFDEDGDYRSFFGTGELPHLNHENEETRQYVFDLARYWVTEYGIDGYDLDYAIGPSLEFWAEFGRSVRDVSDQVVIFTEGVTTPGSLLNFKGRIDGCQDFAFCQIARRTFAYKQKTVEEFEGFLAGSDHYFPDGFVAPVMIDNHNMDRFLFVAGNDYRRLHVAAACLYSMSRPISVWAGTEIGQLQPIGVFGNTLSASRDAYAWDNIHEPTLAWFQAIGKLRAKHESLSKGKRVPLIADAETGILAYEKVAGTGRCVVVLNTSDQEQEISLKEAAGCKDVLSDFTVETADGMGRIIIPAWSAAYLVPIK